MGVSENTGTSFWGPYNKDPIIKGTILGSPIFGNSHINDLYFLKPSAFTLQSLTFSSGALLGLGI